MNQETTLRTSPAADRLLALDAVRGLAVIGMFIQHFALQPWSAFVSGNTMILFILCSGISYSMMAQGMWKRDTAEPVFRARVLARAVFIDLIGYLILMLNGPFGVVLQAYAMLFLLALPLVKCSTKSLIVISAVSFLACPPIMLVGMSLLDGVALLYDIAGGPLSGVAWLPVFVTGMVIGRLDLRASKTAIRLAGVGTAVALPVKLFSAAVLPGIYQSFCDWLVQFSSSAAMPDAYAPWPRNTLAPLWQMLFLDAPQGGSAFELLIGTGGSMVLLAAALLLEKKLPLLFRPFANVGKAALTLYSTQFVLAWILMLLGMAPSSLAQFPGGDIMVILITLAAGWVLSLRKNGPLETAIRWFERQFYKENRKNDETAA